MWKTVGRRRGRLNHIVTPLVKILNAPYLIHFKIKNYYIKLVYLSNIYHLIYQMTKNICAPDGCYAQYCAAKESDIKS